MVNNGNYTRKYKIFYLIIVAITIGSAFFIQNIIILNKVGVDNYSAIPLKGHIGHMTDMSGFASSATRVNSITIGDLYTKEFAKYKGIKPGICFLIQKLRIFMTGNFLSAYLSLNFIIPFLYILLIFFFLYKILCVNYILSIAGAVSVLSLSDIINSIFNLHFANFIHSFFDFANGNYQFGYFARIPFAQLSFFFLIAFMIIFTYSILNKKFGLSIVAGISYGLLFYVYFYYWTYISMFLTIYLIISIVRHNNDHIKFITTVIIVGLLVGLYYIVNYLAFQNYNFTSEYIRKIGMVFGRSIEKKSIVEILIIISLIVFILKGKFKKIDIIIISFISAIVPLMSIQLVTGYTLEPEHFRLTVWTPFIIIFFFYYFERIFNKFKFKNTIAISLIIFCIFLPFYNNSRFALKSYNCYKIENSKREIADYVKSNIEEEHVIAIIDIPLNSYLSYNIKNPLYISNGFYNYLSAEETIDRTILLLCIKGFDKEYVKMLIKSSSLGGNCFDNDSLYNIKAWNFYYLHTYYFDYSRLEFDIPDDEIHRILAKYDAIEIDSCKINFDILITRGEIYNNYSNYFKRIYNSGEYSVYRKKE
jgi:hypothetical protein